MMQCSTIRVRYSYIYVFFFFSSRRRHTRLQGDWSSDVCSSDLDAATYMIDRKNHGFNSVAIYILCAANVGGGADGSTLDGILPFTKNISSSTDYDLTAANESYFKRVDDMVNIAATNGLLAILDPIETDGWLTTLHSNGNSKCLTYGHYLGNRYKNYT